MRLKFCLPGFFLSLVCLASGSALAQTLAPTGAGEPVPADFGPSDLGPIPVAAPQPQTRPANAGGGAHEPASLFLLGVGFVALGIGIAAASRRQTAEPDSTSAWSGALPAEE